MVLSWIWTGLVALSIVFSALYGRGGELAAAVFSGAQAGVTLAISLTGSICLWSGVGKLMTHLGLTENLSRLLRPALGRVFPETKENPEAGSFLSANICANLLGLGNAATPMGIRAVQRLGRGQGMASDEMCRLIVLNTASIQLIPTSVAAVRAGLGAAAPFDILPAVWIASLCSAGLGVTAAWILGKVWLHD